METRVYVSNLEYLHNPANLSTAYDLLPQFRREKFNRLKFDSGKRECAGAWLLFCRALNDQGISESELDFSENEHGKPLAKWKKEGNFHFNFSHSGEWVMCAVSSEPIGCDVEQAKKSWPDIKKIARSALTENELNLLTDPDLFYRIWTRKESLMKLTGLGFSLPMPKFAVWPDIDVSKALDIVSDIKCSFSEFKIDNYYFCCCSETTPACFINYDLESNTEKLI